MTQSTRTSLTFSTLAAALACAAGCMTDEMTTDDELVDETEQEIHSAGVVASTFQIQRAAILTNLGTRASRRCTATVIGPSHVLMAARCKPQIDERILFYSSSLANESSDRFIVDVDFPPGVDPNSGDYSDSDGKFADLAIVRLSQPVPSTSVAATLAWRYPSGGDDEGSKVGAGQHQTSSTASLLRQISDLTYSDHDNDGHFLTEGQQTNTFDEGGPFYFNSRVLGVLHGSVWEWANRDKYASVPESMDWIVLHNGYTWTHSRFTFRRISAGTAIESFVAESETVCQYACDKTSSCTGYSINRTSPQTCSLFSSVTQTAESSFHHMGRR